MLAMTVSTGTARQVRITSRMEQIIKHMLEDPKAEYYLGGICSATNTFPGTISPLLRRMEDAGWLQSKVVHARVGMLGPARKYYRFTAGSAAMLRKAIR